MKFQSSPNQRSCTLLGKSLFCAQSHIIRGQQLRVARTRARLNWKSPPHFFKNRWPGMNRGFCSSLETHRIRIEVPSTSARSGNRVSQPQTMIESSILHYSKDRYISSIFSQELPQQIFFSLKNLSLFSHRKYFNGGKINLSRSARWGED